MGIRVPHGVLDYLFTACYRFLMNGDNIFFVNTIAFIYIATIILWKLPHYQARNIASAPSNDMETLIKINGVIHESRKVVAQVLAGAFLLAGMIFTWFNVSLSQKQLIINQDKQNHDKLDAAVKSLDNDKIYVRLAAISSLDGLKNDKSLSYQIETIVFNYIRYRCNKDKASLKNNYYKADSYDDIQMAIKIVSLLPNNMANLQLNGINFDWRNFQNTNFDNSDLINASFYKCKFYNVSFKNVNLSNANIKGAIFDKESLITQGQIDASKCDKETQLPVGLKYTCLDK